MIPSWARTPMRNNDFNYREMDPLGYACPLGRPRSTAQPA